MTCCVEFQPLGVRLECSLGNNLFQAATGSGIRLMTVCGGRGLCGRCRVRVLAGEIPPPNESDRRRLSPEELAAGYRLSCRLHLTGDLKVEMPPEMLAATTQLQVAGAEVEIFPDPPVRQVALELAKPSRADLRSDWERVRAALRDACGEDSLPDAVALRALSPLARSGDWRLRVARREREVVHFAPVDEAPLGVAVDLGTTKLAAFVLDLVNGRLLASGGELNPQIAYGEDVMSRVTWAMTKGAAVLQTAVVEGLNRLVAGLVPKPAAIEEVVLVANTAMHHLFAGLPVEQLALAPYLPAVS